MVLQRYDRNRMRSSPKENNLRNSKSISVLDNPSRQKDHDPDYPQNPLVGIIMGSDSDLPIMQESTKILEEFEIPFELKIVSAHRTPNEMYDYAESAIKRGLKVIICGAGGAAHLPGMIASLTPLPVVGVPICSSKNTLGGVDSLYSIVQMPPGIPVATVAINGAKNAGILACSILSTINSELLDKLLDYKKKMKDEVDRKNKKLKDIGYKYYFGNNAS